MKIGNDELHNAQNEDSEDDYKSVPDDTNDGIFYPFEDQEQQKQITITEYERKMDEDSDIPSSNVNTSHLSTINNYPSGIQCSSLMLAWSEDDEITAYESETIPLSIDHQSPEMKNNNNSNNNQIAWLNESIKGAEPMKYDESAYNILHQFNTEWPCLTFDFIPDTLGAIRTNIPFSLYLVTGTQADPNYRRNSNQNNHKQNTRVQNKISFLKLSDLQKTKYDEDDSEEHMDREYSAITDDNALMQNRDIYHPSVINRIRMCKTGGINNRQLVAVMSEDSKMYIYSGKQHILSLDGLCADIELCHHSIQPLFESTFIDEGYGLAWSGFDEGWLVCGSNVGELRLYKCNGSAFKRNVQYRTLKTSIEDIQWSPNNRNVFATVGVDKCIRVWDQRSKGKREHVSRVSNAHTMDINVLSWNPHPSHEHLLLTGSDDHSFKIWDMRKMQNDDGLFCKKLKRCVYHYMSKWHLGAITSIEWHPMDSSTAIVSSDDNQISIWDFSLEEDGSETHMGAALPHGCKLPPQLTFIHGGQQDIKEVHWHEQIPNLVVSTAGSGFHCFQADNLMEAFMKEFSQMTVLNEEDPCVPKD